MVFSTAHDWMEMNYSFLSSSSETNQHLIWSNEYSYHSHPNQALPNNLYQKGIFFSSLQIADLNIILWLHLSICAISDVSDDSTSFHLFSLKYRLIPGLAYTVRVRFCPDEWRYFYDCIRVHCKVRIQNFVRHCGRRAAVWLGVSCSLLMLFVLHLNL